MKPIDQLIQKLEEAKAITVENMHAENIDLEDMFQTLDILIDDLKNIGDFEVYEED